mmetsp:Transcript_52597/g.153313  ORF Transcript_52597/g.153313 Transcript_52597/m.153313 type:complete len:235 (+) Transcript_52597:1233-1937(+)
MAAMYFVFASEHSTPYFSLALSRSYTFLTASWRSNFTCSTSFSKVCERPSCCFTNSDCFFVRSSVFIKPRFRDSRSRMMSSIVLASVSICFLTNSISRIKFSASVLRTPRWSSNCFRSSSSKPMRRFKRSYCFCSLSLSDCQFLISSCLPLRVLPSSRFSSCKTLRFSSSSALTRFMSSISFLIRDSSCAMPEAMRCCSFSDFSKISICSSWPRMSFLMLRKVFSRPSKVCFSS